MGRMILEITILTAEGSTGRQTIESHTQSVSVVTPLAEKSTAVIFFRTAFRLSVRRSRPQRRAARALLDNV